MLLSLDDITLLTALIWTQLSAASRCQNIDIKGIGTPTSSPTLLVALHY